MIVFTPLKAIRRKCVDCSGGSSKAVRWCPITDCPLWPYRFGCRPKSARQRHGDQLVTPELMPSTNTPLEALT
jgi:hypothetical protein